MTPNRRIGALLLIGLSGCVQPEDSAATPQVICKLETSGIQPSILHAIDRGGGSIIGGCYSNQRHIVFYNIRGACEQPSTMVGVDQDAESIIERCSPLSAESGASEGRSFILKKSADKGDGIALELYNAAGAGLLPISYMQQHNGVTCLEATSWDFVDAADALGLETRQDQWIESREPCALSAPPFTGTGWPGRTQHIPSAVEAR